MKAAFKGHLTVLQTLVEQYGGNVRHRKKVKCYNKLIPDFSSAENIYVNELNVMSLLVQIFMCDYTDMITVS